MKPYRHLAQIVTIVAFAIFTTGAYAQMISIRNTSGMPLTAASDIVGKYAGLMNLPKDSIKNVKLYSLIEQFSSTPYKYGGNDANGVDCSGFACIVEKQVYGTTIPRTVTLEMAAAKPKTVDALKGGDLVFLKSHTVGLYLQNGYFAEVISNGGVILNNVNDPDQQQRIGSYGAMK